MITSKRRADKNEVIVEITDYGCDICYCSLRRINGELYCPQDPKYYQLTFGKKIAIIGRGQKILSE